MSDTNNFIRSIADKIREQREKLGWSQRELAEKIDIPQPTLARIESGESGFNLTTASKILQELGLTLDFTEKQETTVFDVVDFILDYAKKTLNKEESYYDVSNMKLQKLLYYLYSKYFVLTGKSLFQNKFEAWPHGPVYPEVYAEYKRFGNQNIEINNVSKIKFSLEDRKTMERVLKDYISASAFDLREQSHKELPWKRAILRSKKSGINKILDIDMVKEFTN
jgi:uncharacterized phage-associated protein